VLVTGVVVTRVLGRSELGLGEVPDPVDELLLGLGQPELRHAADRIAS
jgi:hypothetical protein